MTDIDIVKKYSIPCVEFCTLLSSDIMVLSPGSSDESGGDPYGYVGESWSGVLDGLEKKT